MPTVRREPHEHRAMAESFGADAERYDRVRPRYPEDMVERIVAASPGPEFLDVGCGTGIASRQFRAAGCHVTGIDVDSRMAEAARRSGIAVEVAKFEEWDAGGREFDAVIAGQTWHWVDPVLGAEKAARALRPRGRLALFWNVFDPPKEIREEFASVYTAKMPGLPYNPWSRPIIESYSGILTGISNGIDHSGGFGATEEWTFRWEQDYRRDEWLEQARTHGGHNQLAPEKLEDVLAGIGAAIDSVGGRFTMPYITVVCTAAHR